MTEYYKEKAAEYYKKWVEAMDNNDVRMAKIHAREHSNYLELIKQRGE